MAGLRSPSARCWASLLDSVLQGDGFLDEFRRAMPMIPIVSSPYPNSPSSFRGRNMPIRSFITRSLLILNALVVFTQCLRAEERPANPSAEKVVSFPAADDVNQLYVAVMGEVDTPGTYCVNSIGLTMHRMIESALHRTRRWPSESSDQDGFVKRKFFPKKMTRI